MHQHNLIPSGGEESKKGEGEGTYNCRHIPHGLAPGFISVATAIALKDLWPCICHHPIIIKSIFPFLEGRRRGAKTDKSSTKCNPLRANAYRVRGILNICAEDVLAACRDEACAYAEFAVGAFFVNPLTLQRVIWKGRRWRGVQ